MDKPIMISAHARPDVSDATAEALARMILHACPEIEYRRQAGLAPMLVAEITALKAALPTGDSDLGR